MAVHAFDPEPDKIVVNRMGRSDMLFCDDDFNAGAGACIASLVEWRPDKHWRMSVEYDERFFWGFDACKGSTIGTTDCTADAQERLRRNANFDTRRVRVRLQIACNTGIAWSTLVQVRQPLEWALGPVAAALEFPLPKAALAGR